jgi:hypothetical protein
MTKNDRHVLDALGGKEIPWGDLTEGQQARVRRLSRELRAGPYTPRDANEHEDPRDCEIPQMRVLLLLGETRLTTAWKRMVALDKARIRGLGDKIIFREQMLNKASDFV